MLQRTSALILAAGQGTRMKSALPKVLHPVAGRPLIHFPVRAALEAGCAEVVVVVGHGREQVEAYLASAFDPAKVRCAVQKEQRGTGDAAAAGLAKVDSKSTHVLIFYGDVPLIRSKDVAEVVLRLDEDKSATLSLATCELENPFGYGRVMRNGAGDIVEIREQKDLTSDAERAVREINPGVYAAPVSFLRDALASLTPNNAQGEYYLTDIVSFAVSKNLRVTHAAAVPDVMDGVNDREQLAAADRRMIARIQEKLRKRGVTIRDSARIEDGVEVGQDTVIECGAVLRGATRVGANALVDVGCVLTDAIVADGATLKPYSVLSEARVGTKAHIGPFSHLRPESLIGDEAHVGNFVETKKTRMERGSKANHLAYLGDGIIGEGANVGAGTIFCNYDGFQKHVTTIGKNAFIGSDSQLVAPITIGEGAYVATGTTVTRDVPADALAISRVKQENKEGYASRLRAKLKAAKEAKKG